MPEGVRGAGDITGTKILTHRIFEQWEGEATPSKKPSAEDGVFKQNLLEHAVLS